MLLLGIGLLLLNYFALHIFLLSHPEVSGERQRCGVSDSSVVWHRAFVFLYFAIGSYGKAFCACARFIPFGRYLEPVFPFSPTVVFYFFFVGDKSRISAMKIEFYLSFFLILAMEVVNYAGWNVTHSIGDYDRSIHVLFSNDVPYAPRKMWEIYQ